MQEYFINLNDAVEAVRKTYRAWMNDVLESKEDEETLAEVLQDVINELVKLHKYYQ